jgi:O-antigen/teichoic acid export membrane protein
LLVYLDRFAIGAVIGSAAVGLYTVPYAVISQLAVLPGALATALFPRLAAASDEGAANLSREAQLVLVCIVTPVTLLAAVCVGPFFQVWLGPDIGNASAPVALLLLFGFWANSFARIPFARLQAQGKPEQIARVHLAEIIPYLAFLYFAMRHWGIMGAALTWSTRTAADALVLILLAKIEWRVLKILLLHGVIVATSILIILLVPNAVSRWLLLSVLAVLTAILLVRNAPPALSKYLSRLSHGDSFETERAP